MGVTEDCLLFRHIFKLKLGYQSKGIYSPLLPGKSDAKFPLAIYKIGTHYVPILGSHKSCVYEVYILGKLGKDLS